MVTVNFEVVRCEGSLDIAAKYRLVLFSTGDRDGEPKSPYKQGASALTWDKPFPSLSLPSSDTSVRIPIALRRKPDRFSRHGRNLCSFVLDLTHDCMSKTVELVGVKSEITPTPKLSVRFTATGFPNAENNAKLLSNAKVASEDASHEQEATRSRSLPFDVLGENVPGSDLVAVGGAMSSGLSHLDALAKIIDVASDIHPLVKGVWSLFNVAYTLIKQQSELDEKIVVLIRALNANCSFAEALSANKNTTAAESIMRSILREVLNGATLVKEYCVVRKSSLSVLKFVGSPLASRVDACLETLDFFRRELGDHTAVTIHRDLQTLAASLSRDFDRLNRFVEVQENETLLKQMPYAADADRDLRSRDRGCLPGTREEIIRTIVDWAVGALPESSETYIRGLNRDARVLWLCGVAGSGKSSIAISVARVLRSMDRLAALYGFETAFQGTLNPTNLFSTIARQHAERRPNRKQHLLRTLEHMDPDQRASTSASDQFRSFITSASTEETSVFDDIVIIDAFDESGLASAREATLLALSPAHTSDFPNGLRFVITCRPDDDVVRRLESVLDCDQPATSFLRMEDIYPPHTERDIELYVIHMLGKVYGLEASRASGDLARLAVTAEHSFQWVSVACRYIMDSDDRDGARLPDERLEETLATRGGLDTLYLSILDRSFGSSIARESPSTRSLRFILGSLVCAFEPVSVQTIAALASANPLVQTVDETKFHFVARKLSSIVTGTTDVSTPLVAFHTSFTDLLADEQRSKSYAVSLPEVHHQMALSSLGVMERYLRFNICHLESSYLRNDAVPDLDERIKQYIPEELLYACRFWPAHVAAALAIASATTAALQHSLTKFLESKGLLLAWLEVMSVTGHDPLPVLDPLAVPRVPDSDLLYDLYDLVSFVNWFIIPIRTSVPHIYLSALAFTPFSSAIADIWVDFPNLVLTASPAPTWPPVRHILSHTTEVYSVAFSPDGKWIVSGSRLGIVRVWDVYSGRAGLPAMSTSTPADGHVRVVAFSPDGSTVASAYGNKSIRLWDLRTMSTSGKRLTGHADEVTSITFAPDGTLLASGSCDGTVRLWDVHSSTAVREPIWDNRSPVRSIAFSSDGSLLAHGSEDGTLGLWNARNRCAHGKPFNAHSDHVCTLAFSLDGALLVSGSRDKTIRIWDVQTLAGLGVLSGHTGWVTSVSFLPVGEFFLASCSSDKTIRLWNLRARSQVGAPLTGHTDAVHDVCFSPNGFLMASASSDRTVHLWSSGPPAPSEAPTTHLILGPIASFSRDANLVATTTEGFAVQIFDTHSSLAIGHPMTGHKDKINEVILSSDGRLLASASFDQSVRLWEVGKEGAVGTPLNGDTTRIQSLAFSQDGTMLASGSSDGVVQLWDVKTFSAAGQPLEGHTDKVTCVSFSPNGDLLASSSFDHTVRLWDVRRPSSLGPPLKGHVSTVTSVAFSPDGALLASASWDRTIRLWDVCTLAAVGEPLGEDPGWVLSVVFSPNGLLLASYSTTLMIRLWDISALTGVKTLLVGHTRRPLAFMFSPDSALLVSASHDGTIRRWDLHSISPSRAGNKEEEPASSHIARPALPGLFPAIDAFPALGPNVLVQLKDGWVVGPSRELILWIPPSIRHSLSSVYEVERLGHPPLIKLDFSHFACGLDWTKCYSPSPDPSSDAS